MNRRTYVFVTPTRIFNQPMFQVILVTLDLSELPMVMG